MLLFSQESVVSWIPPNPQLEAGMAVRLSVQDAHFSEGGGGGGVAGDDMAQKDRRNLSPHSQTST